MSALAHLTDYPARDAARLVYLAWLSRVNETRRGCALPALETKEPKAPGKSANALRNLI